MSSIKLRVFLSVGVVALAGIGFGAYRMTAIAKDAPKTTAKLPPAPAEPARTDKPAALWGKSCDAGPDGKQTCVVVQNIVITDKGTNNSLRALSVAVGFL